MNLSDLNPLVAIGGKILDRVLPDPSAAAAAKAELIKMEQNYMEYLNNTSTQITRDRTMLLMNGFDQELNKV